MSGIVTAATGTASAPNVQAHVNVLYVSFEILRENTTIDQPRVRPIVI